jgi:hypothetical protein
MSVEILRLDIEWVFREMQNIFLRALVNFFNFEAALFQNNSCHWGLVI